MKKLLILISAACLLVPAMVFAAGNPNPTLYLEIYNSPTDKCYCTYVPGGPPLTCWNGIKTQCFVFLHVGKVPNGFLGTPHGIAYTGDPFDYLSTTACPGFLKGPSTAGEPDAIVVSSTGECHMWDHHSCYTRWMSGTGADSFFDIVANADLGHYKVINCDNLYDEGTVIGGRAEWSDVQSIVCGEDPTTVEETTWGKIKGLYR
jgi:hypothetical protein